MVEGKKVKRCVNAIVDFRLSIGNSDVVDLGARGKNGQKFTLDRRSNFLVFVACLDMKAHGFRGVLGLGILIGAIVFCFASAATPLEENAQSTPSPQRLPANQPNKTKSKHDPNANAALKEKQSKNSQSLESNGQRKDANSRRQVESHRSERRQEKADLITTAAGVVLSAIRKPAPNPTPQPAPVVVRTTPAEPKSTPHKRSHPKSIDDDVWSRINPVSK